VVADAKKPWRELSFSGRIECNFIFSTTLSRSILPFALFRPDLVVLPVHIKRNQAGNKEIRLLTANEIRREGYLDVARWFKNAERIWDLKKTEK
jgi:hypothetical protein